MSLTEAKFHVTVTAIVVNQHGECLLTKRHKDKKRWPGKWTVPGGHVTPEDFIGKPTEINNQWYDVLEHAVAREIKEETGIDNIYDLRYICSVAVPDSIIVSFEASVVNNNELTLQKDECDAYAWVSQEEAAEYDLIDGILGEIKQTRTKVAR